MFLMKRRLVNLSKLHRKIYGEKLVELANIVFAALVIGQFVSGKGFVPEVGLLGTTVSAILYITSYVLLRGGGE